MFSRRSHDRLGGELQTNLIFFGDALNIFECGMVPTLRWPPPCLTFTRRYQLGEDAASRAGNCVDRIADFQINIAGGWLARISHTRCACAGSRSRQGRRRAQFDVGHRASAATHPVGFFNRPFGLPDLWPSSASGGSTVCPDKLCRRPPYLARRPAFAGASAGAGGRPVVARRAKTGTAKQAAWSVRNGG